MKSEVIPCYLNKNHMDFLELAKSRYSCRMYSDRPVEKEKIELLLKAAQSSPSAKNLQPCHIWLVKSEKALSRMRAIHSLYKAPLALILGYDREKSWVRDFDKKNHGEIDASIMSAHIILEAQQLGLGSTWIGHFDPEKLAESFPELAGYEITAVLAIGYKAALCVPAPMHIVRKSTEKFTTEL